MKGKDESPDDKWISVTSNDVHYIQFCVVCDFYGIWLSSNYFIHVQVLAEGIYTSCQNKTCIKVHRVLSTFCHVIVEKNPSYFRTCGFFWKCTDEEMLGEQ